jgi:methylenetetrahydrofolate dehydrogenase (NADP+)/methenyltetrahydrofolate cyclohydrolase
MSAIILDGKQIASEIRAELAAEVSRLQAEWGVTPGLAVILVGEDPASQSYVKAKEKACADIGIYSDDNRLPADTTQEELLRLIAAKNADPRIHGILVQLPLPRQISTGAVIEAIAPEKDVDGFGAASLGKLMQGEQTFISCTPHGVVQMLMHAGVKTAGKEAVIVGRSNIVGKPLANLLMQKAPYGNATVTVCHSQTPNLAEITRRADILVAAIGRPRTITADMVKPGAVVIDVGVNRIPDPSAPRGHRLVGDVDFDAVKEVASVITPVPGGVGPMTITMLLYNTVQSARLTAR